MWLIEDNDPTLFYSSVKVHEFLIVLTPSNEICNDVQRFKDKLANSFGRFDSYYSKAHFTLVNFICNKEQEHQLLSAIKKGCAQIKSFDITLDKIDAFKYSGTLYINPIEKDNIIQLSHEIYKELIKNGISKKNLITAKTPHLTIARKLNKLQFDLALEEFQKIGYKNHFKAKEITILKRNNAKKYEVFSSIKLKD